MKIFFDILVFFSIGLALLFVYVQYWDTIKMALFGEESVYTLYIGEVPVFVTVADTSDERERGLSGVTRLETNQGKLFVFDVSGKYGIWMKDMLIPIDILWIDENLRVVHIEEQVQPDTFPQVFAPQTDARFVLEVNSFFVNSLKLSVGDSVFIPSEILPQDIRRKLQQ